MANSLSVKYNLTLDTKSTQKCDTTIYTQVGENITLQCTIQEDGIAKDLTNAKVDMIGSLQNSNGNTALFEQKNDDVTNGGKITITDALQGKITIDIRKNITDISCVGVMELHIYNTEKCITNRFIIRIDESYANSALTLVSDSLTLQKLENLLNNYQAIIDNGHIHKNLATLIKLSEDANGKLLYNGITIEGGGSGSSSNIDTTNFATKTELNNYVSKVSGKSLIADTEITRLATVNNYTHPNDVNTRHVTDTEKANWNGKSNLVLGNTSVTAYRGDYGEVAYNHSQSIHAPSNAKQNVQSDWNITDINSDAYIKNKPSIPTVSNVEDNLTSTSVINSLSANQGRVIDGKINGLQTTIGTKVNQAYVDEAVRGVISGTSDINGLIRNGSSEGYKGYTIKNGIRPCISFSDDDGKVGVYTKWKPILESKNIPMSICIIPDYIGLNGYMTWVQVRELQNTNKCEILSHNMNHANFSTIYNSEIINSLKQSKEILMANGLRINGFAYPNGGFYSKDAGQDVSYLCAKEYDYAVITQNKINTYPITNSMVIDRCGIGCYESTELQTLDGMKAKVNDCVNKNGWLIFMTHVDDVTHTTEDTTNLGLLIDYIKSLGTIDIVTIREGYQRFGNILESEKGQLTKQGDLFGLSGGGTGSYTLPKATTTTLGGIKLGTGLSITNEGILNNESYSKVEVDNLITTINNRLAVLEGGTAQSYGNIVLSKTTINIVEGASDSFTVVLSKAPTNNQVVTLTKNNDDVLLNSTSLTFTPSNYNIPQTISFNIAEDNADYSNETCIMTLASPNVNSVTVTVNITDNDTPPTNYDLTYNLSATGVTKTADKTYKLIDDDKWNNVFMMYDSTKIPLGNYNVCIQVLERTITTTTSIELPTKWSITHDTSFTSKLNLMTCSLNTTYKIPVTLYENTEPLASAFICGVQFSNANTKDNITVKMWIEK